ncbi:MFS transporter [Actinophytocola sp.]|uniref:MFS transporter n=1 Tax=Actinophytocola sp. TaxID=1872138 RepID=UPI003D6AE3F9
MIKDLAVLRERAFRTLFAARTVSLLGDAMAPVALAFAVLALPNGTATTLGIVIAARIVTQVAFLLLGGMIADRLPRLRVMVVADLIAFVSQGGVAALFISGSSAIPLIAALAAVSGGATALFRPAARAVVPQVVDEESLQPANALLRLSMNAGSVLGAAMAGVLVALVGPGWALGVDALTFLASAILLSAVRTRHTVAAASGRPLTQLREGWHEFTSRTWVWAMVAQLAFANVCIAGGIVVLGPVVAKDHLGGAPAWALAVAAQSAGLVVGSLVAIRIRPRHPVRVAALMTIGFAPPLLALGTYVPLYAVVAGMFVIGFCIDIYEVLFQTALQRHVPPQALARVMSYDSFGSYALIPVGLVVAGPISALVGVRATLVGAAALVLVSGALVLLSTSVRNLRGEPDASQTDVSDDSSTLVRSPTTSGSDH